MPFQPLRGLIQRGEKMAQNKDKPLHLTAKQIKGVDALLAADTVEQAAERAGVTRTTLYRWLRNEAFASELTKAKRRLVQQGILKLQRAVSDAVKVLVDISKDKDAPASSRVSAAREILTQALKGLELEDLKERVDALEKLLKQGAGK